MLRQPFLYYTGFGLACARLLVAFQLLMVSITDTDAIGLQLEFDDVFSAAYAVFALCTVVLTSRSWWWDYRLSLVQSGVDYLVLLCLIALYAPSQSGYLASTICMYAFVVIGSALRWGSAASYNIAAVTNSSGW